MDAFNPSNKKRKICDKICGGVHDSSLYVDKTIFDDGKLTFTCPSKSSSTMHNIELVVLDNKPIFKCSCSGGFDNIETQYCKHIESVIINFCKSYIENACKFINDKDKHIRTKKIMDKIAEQLDCMIIK